MNWSIIHLIQQSSQGITREAVRRLARRGGADFIQAGDNRGTKAVRDHFLSCFRQDKEVEETTRPLSSDESASSPVSRPPTPLSSGEQTVPSHDEDPAISGVSGASSSAPTIHTEDAEANQVNPP